MQFLRELKQLNEAYIDHGIEDELKRQGYRFLGAGVDQQAWLAKNGTIMKIFGSNRTGKVSSGHKMFYEWEKFCKKWSHSHLVPIILNSLNSNSKTKPTCKLEWSVYLI